MRRPTWPIVCGTGHRRPHPRPDAEAWVRRHLRTVLRQLRDDHGTRVVISGLALRFDTWLADDALALGMELWAYMPHPGQADRWSRADIAHWNRLRAAATKERFADEGDVFKLQFLHARNDMMFADAQIGITDWRPGRRDGGTYGGMKCALRRERPVIWLNPSLDTPDCEQPCCQPRMPTLDRWAELLGVERRPRRKQDPQLALPI